MEGNELSFLAELRAAAELNLGIAKGGVSAALGFLLGFDLFDPNDDGKVRLEEMLGNIQNQIRAKPALAPLAIFDVSGQIYAKLSAFLELNLGIVKKKFNFPIFGPETLFDFEIDFFRPPILASELDNGDLLIHTGEFAQKRLLGNARDLAEHIVIKSDGTTDDGEFVKVLIAGGTGEGRLARR